MKYKIRRIGYCFLISSLVLLLVSSQASGAYSKVVTFGADLTQEQKTVIASEFGINIAQSEVPVIDVTNAEERKYLQGLVPDNVIGNRAISSALVEVLPPGRGIKVKSRNITWVTNDMYANALTTAGVKDASVIVSAPFPVSGTAALTGIFKGFEAVTGKSLGDRAKKIANEELVKTGKLGQEIGKAKAAKLIMMVKERVAAERPKNQKQIRQIIINVAGDLNINLTNGQIDEVAALMQKINGLNLELKDLTRQLSGYRSEVERAISKQPQIKTWLQRLFDALNRLIEQVRSLILGREQ